MVFHALFSPDPEGDVKSRGRSPRFEPLSRDLSNVSVLKNHVESLLLQKITKS